MFNKSYNKDTVGVIRYACGLLFTLFAIAYLYFLQGDVIGQAQYIYSGGITTYSLLGGSIVIPLVLMVVQWLVSLVSMLPPRFHALSYIPSAYMLGVLSQVDEFALGHEEYSTLILPSVIIVALYIMLCVVAHKVDSLLSDSESDIKTFLYPNCIILLVCIIAIGSMSDTKDVAQYELKAERLILEKDYASASKVAEKSLRTSRFLTQLRMLALSQQNLLAECLFDYPQHYGSAGLLDIADTSRLHRVNANDICLHLGAFCGQSITNTSRYYDIMLSDTLWNQHTADYYLCSLLLDKKLRTFHDKLPLYYNLSDTLPNAYDQLPRSYKEALLLLSDEHYARQGKIVIDGDSLATLSDTLYAYAYSDYLSMKVGISNHRERVNKTHREHGKTYWWYYDYSDQGNGELIATENKSQADHK